MPRKYVRKTEVSSVDPNVVLESIKAIKLEKKSVVSVAQIHNIPKSSLFRYLGKVNQKFPDFSKATEPKLLEFICIITKASGKKPVNF